MPVIRIDLFPGRSAEVKQAIAREITDVLNTVAGIKPTDTTIIFSEVPATEWFVAGEACSGKVVQPQD
ncbi:MAG: 4-oxalocrotonate tautomerase family protein [Brucellaceae bacterium]|nr:4-oxalocrotonate tautomerase family protein [Brucellaceae bacterium]